MTFYKFIAGWELEHSNEANGNHYCRNQNQVQCGNGGTP